MALLVDKDLQAMDRFDDIIAVLKKLTGKEFGRNPAKWRKWWSENKSQILKEAAEK